MAVLFEAGPYPNAGTTRFTALEEWVMPHIADKAANGSKLGDQIEAAEKCVGYMLQDPLGQKIGSVEKLFVNDRGEPEYIWVKMGLLGPRSALIPVQFVEVRSEQRIIVLQ